MNKKKYVKLYILLTLGITWLIQFLPIILNLEMEDASVSSFDLAGLLFTIGGMMPTLIGLIFVFVIYDKEEIKEFLKRCFIPNKNSFICILLVFLLICLEATITQLISKLFNASNLGFIGLINIFKNPLFIFYYLFWGLISGPLSEEFGWRGFLQDMLWDKNNLLKNSLLIGFIWGVWHLPLFFYPSQIQYEWINTSLFLGIGFVINCMTNALVYNSAYVISKRKVFPIFFIHMFENIILTGIMIYPFSNIYKNIVIIVSICFDLLFYFIIINTKYYKNILSELE